MAGGSPNAFRGRDARFCLVSFDTDWLYPTAESRAIVHALNAAGAPVSFVELSSPYGHDAFLLDPPELDRVVARVPGGAAMTLRPDLASSPPMSRPGARVLDVGCGDGALMAALRDEQAGRRARAGDRCGQRRRGGRRAGCR